MDDLYGGSLNYKFETMDSHVTLSIHTEVVE
jgi:hypothetical protein